MKNAKFLKRFTCLLLALTVLLSGCLGDAGEDPSEDPTGELVDEKGPSAFELRSFGGYVAPGEESFSPIETVTELASNGTVATALTLSDLKTSDVARPTQLDETPAFSWKLNSNVVGVKQASYRITVAEEDTAQVAWDSGVVESDASYDVRYAGQALTPRTDYVWQVAVTDNHGNTASAQAKFTTGIMDSDISAWKDSGGNVAQWIGHPELSVDASSLYFFGVSVNFTVTADSAKRFGFVYGAEDIRLSKKPYNGFGAEGENYVAVVIDTSGLASGGTAVLEVLRKNYCAADMANPGGVTVIASVEISSDILNSSNLNGAHTLTFTEDFGKASKISIDGSWIGSYSVNPDSLNTVGYPVMGSIGFIAEGGSMSFSDLKLTAYRDNSGVGSGDGEHKVIFGQNVGATYSIFEGVPGLTVSGNTVTVKDAAAYADPSYGSVTYARTRFTAGKAIDKARLYVTSRGVYECYVNGKPVESDTLYHVDADGNEYRQDYFNPGSSTYNASISYCAYDITDMMKSGDNVIGAILSSGWWTSGMTYGPDYTDYWGSRPGLLAMLDVTYADGTAETVVTNTRDWTVYNNGPIRLSSFFHGERYDGTYEANVAGWSTASYDDSGWVAPVEVHAWRDAFDRPAIIGMVDVPAHVFEVIEPIGSAEKKTFGGQTVYHYNMGTNLTGIPKITLPQLKKGTKVLIRVAEVLYPELAADNQFYYGELAGMLLNENYRAALNYYTYTASGASGGETFLPQLTFTGYQYLELSIFGDYTDAEIDRIIANTRVQGLAISSLTQITSAYQSDNELVNQLFDNIRRSALGNHISIPTDCPQRDERMGWNGDASIFAAGAVYMSNMNSLYSYWAGMLRNEQERGGVGDYGSYVPSYDTPGDGLGIVWRDVGISITYALWRQTGDTTIVSEMWDSMKWYMSTLIDGGHPKGCAVLTSDSTGLGDHLAPVDSAGFFLNNCTYGHDLWIMSEIARGCGYEEDYAYYAGLYSQFLDEFNDKFVGHDGYLYAGNDNPLETQAVYAMSLAYNFISADRLDGIRATYQRLCEQGHNGVPYTLNTGFVGTPSVLPALTNYGDVDTAYKMFEQTRLVSWLYPVTQGATTIWERWDSLTEENGFGGNNSMNSFNHYSYGVVAAWMMGTQLGISTGAECGYRDFVLQPTAGGTMQTCSGSYDSVCGLIESGWTASGGAIRTYTATVPANSTATLYLPVDGARSVTVTCTGARCLGTITHNGVATVAFELGAGSYQFTVDNGAVTVALADGYAEAAA